MSAEIIDTEGGIVTMKVAGRLAESELADLQQRIVAIVRARGKARILVLAEDFLGWERGGEWTDLSLQAQVDPHIEKMAIVGQPQLKDDVLLFVGQGMRPFPIQHFVPGEAALARAWLDSTA